MATVISQQSRMNLHAEKHPTSMPALDEKKINVGRIERILSALAGGLMVFNGLRKKSLGGAAMVAAGGSLLYRGASGHCGLYQRLHIDTANSDDTFPGLHIEESIVINRPASELYAYWRDFSNLHECIPYIESVQPRGPHEDKVTHWVAKGPAGVSLEWDARIINEKQDELIAWETLPGCSIQHAGSVHFKTLADGSGTEFRVVMNVGPIAEMLGASVAKIWHQPERNIAESLRRFKSRMETGEAYLARSS